MKRPFSALSVAALGFVIASCDTVHHRQAGGASFDDSYLAPKLDSNNPDLERDDLRAESYEQWRESN